MKRRALIVGAGGWSRHWGAILAADERVEIVGWVDLEKQTAESAVNQLGLQGVHIDTDLRTALTVTRPDFVVNVTVPDAHRAVSIEVMEMGIPVLCEKPMATTMADAHAMVAMSERTATLLVVNQQRRFDANLIAMRRLIVDHVASLGILNSDFYLGHREPDYHRRMTSPLILDMAIHTFDAARYLSGVDAVSVYCEDFNPPWSWHSGHSSAMAIFEMSGGLRYCYRGSWAAQGFETTWEAVWRAIGPNGTAVWNGVEAPEAEIVDRPDAVSRTAKRIIAAPPEDLPVGLAGSLDDFLHGLDTGEAPMGECHDNIKSLAMTLGALESAATGQRVSIKSLLNE